MLSRGAHLLDVEDARRHKIMAPDNGTATVRAEDHSSMQTLSHASLSIVVSAISHARSKGHCQVQPLHVAAALLDPLNRSVALHNACLQSLRDPTHPLKCDALDLCFKVALERLPLITDPDKCKEQTMSNALAAALKRAHANERRGTSEQSLQPLLAVKTGTAHLTISILDDPSVSRVFREAGFSSTDVKAKMEEAVAQAACAGHHPPPPSTSISMDALGAGPRRAQLAMSPYSVCGPRLDSGGVQFRNSYYSPMFTAAAVDHPTSNGVSHGRVVERGRGNSHGVLDLQLPDRECANLTTSRIPYSQAAVQDPNVSSPQICAPVTPQLIENAYQPKQRHASFEPNSILAREMDNPLRFPTTTTVRHEAEVRKIVETLLCGPKKRNPVLLSETVVSSVIKELAQHLITGDVPLLRGVKLLELPFTSLSVGMLSVDVVDQKLTKLRREVDACTYNGGVILSVGDLQWLLEPSHSTSSLVLQSLHELMMANAQSRMWLLASSSPEAFERFQLTNNPSLESLGLFPVPLTPDCASVLQQRRYSPLSGSRNGEIAFLSPMGGGGREAAAKPPAVPSEIGLRTESDCCLECSRMLQQECTTIVQEEKQQLLSLRSGPPASSVVDCNTGAGVLQYPCSQNRKDKGCDSLRVKEEENSVVPLKVQELRQKWQQICSTHRSKPISFLPGTPGFLRDSTSNTYPGLEATSSPRDHRSLQLMESSQAASSPAARPPLAAAPRSPQPLKPQLSGSPDERIPLHARYSKGNSNSPNLLIGLKPALPSPLRDAQRNERSKDRSLTMTPGWMRSERSLSGTPPLMRKDTGSGTLVSPGLKLDTAHSDAARARAGSVGTDLALGRPSMGSGASPLSSVAQNRSTVREEGGHVHPLHSSRLHLSSSPAGNMPLRTTASASPLSFSNLTGLREKLEKSVLWQKEAVGAIAAAVTKCRSGDGRMVGSYTSTTMMFTGPDKVGKREVAKSLAKHVFCREDNPFILVTGWAATPGSGGAVTSTGILAADSRGVKYVGHTPLERLADAISRQPRAVVLLENVDRAGPLFLKNLSRAMQIGKLPNAGREVTLANVIFIMTCDAGTSLLAAQHSRYTERRVPIDMDEEELADLSPADVRLVLDSTKSEKVLYTKGPSLSVVEVPAEEESAPAESILIFGSHMFKRKAGNGSANGDDESPSSSTASAGTSTGKKCRTEVSSPGRKLSLDLNRSAEEIISRGDSGGISEDPERGEKSGHEPEPETLGEATAKVLKATKERFPKEMFELLDATIVFKPFNLNGLTDLVLERLDRALEDTLGNPSVPVELDVVVLRRMVCSAWQNFCNLDVFQDWIDDVLMRSIGDELAKASHYPDSLLKITGLAKSTRCQNTDFKVTSLPAPQEHSLELLPRVLVV